MEEICQKSNWGQPIFTLHSKAGTNPDEDALYFFNVMVPGLGMTYFPAKLTHSIEEAMVIAADHSLAQLGYAMEGIAIILTMHGSLEGLSIQPIPNLYPTYKIAKSRATKMPNLEN